LPVENGQGKENKPLRVLAILSVIATPTKRGREKKEKKESPHFLPFTLDLPQSPGMERKGTLNPLNGGGMKRKKKNGVFNIL